MSRRFYENLAQLNKVTEEHSQQQARRGQPTPGEKEDFQQQVRIKRTERALPTAG